MKRLVFLSLGVLGALTWSQSGATQNLVCLAERGQDPLDVLKTNVHHNVWMVLDTSGSMNSEFPDASKPANQQPTRVQAARETIEFVLDHLKDSTNAPLANWGFRYFDSTFQRKNGDKCILPGPTTDANNDGLPDRPSRCGGVDAVQIDPPPCGGADPRPQIRTALANLFDANGNFVTKAKGTPNGIVLDEMTTYVNKEFINNPLRTPVPNQKNFIILLSDGDDTCECYGNRWDGAKGKDQLRGSSTSSAYGRGFIPVDMNHKDYNSNDGDPGQQDVAAYNAGLKARAGYPRIDPKLDGSGDTYVIGMDLSDDSKARANHLAWEASGVALGRQGHGAFFADNRQDLTEALFDVLSRIGVLTTRINFGTPVVATVKELIPLSSNGQADATAVQNKNGGVRNQYRNNVVVNTFVDYPSFQGHLVAQKVFDLVGTQKKVSTAPPLWDAGEELQNREPAPIVAPPTRPTQRTLYFNRLYQKNLRPFVACTDPSAGDDADCVRAKDLGIKNGFLQGVDGKGAKSAEDAVKMIVGVVGGWRLSVHPDTGTLYAPIPGTKTESPNLNFSDQDELGAPTWKLYDMTHQGPTVVLNPPRSLADPAQPANKYGSFFSKYFNRQTMVYVGDNSGVLHAFTADKGVEVFGYIPDDVVGLAPGETEYSRPTLKDFVRATVAKRNGIYNHVYHLAGACTVEEAYLQSKNGGDDDFHTILACGRGPGGKFLTALDVTKAGDWDPNNALPKVDGGGLPKPTLRFNRGNRQGTINDNSADEDLLDGLGETWSAPMMGEVRVAEPLGTPATTRWLLFAGSGYGCSQTDEGKYFYVLRLEDGSVYRRYGPILNAYSTTSPIKDNALVAAATLYNPHTYDPSDSKDYVTRVYASDLRGTIYKLDTSQPNPNAWSFGPFYSLGPEQPIGAPVALLYRDERNGPLVLAGSGNDTRVTKAGVTQDDYFVMAAIVDGSPDGFSPQTCASTTCAVTSTAADGTPFIVSPGGKVLPAGGPFIVNLPARERVYISPVTVPSRGTGGTVFFASSQPQFDSGICAARFSSNLFGFTFAYATGNVLGAFDVAPSTDPSGSKVTLGLGKVSGLYARDQHLWIGLSGLINLNGTVRVLGDDTFPFTTATTSTDRIQLRVERVGLSVF